MALPVFPVTTIATRSQRVRILLSEGSSTNAREVISALGPKGYVLDACDPNPIGPNTNG